jgi:hypothetical protein
MFARHGAVLRLLSSATISAKPNLTSMAVETAVLSFDPQHARDAGCREVNFGGAQGMLIDGVLGHKHKWQARLVERRHDRLQMIPRHGEQVVHSIAMRMPCLGAVAD